MKGEWKQVRWLIVAGKIRLILNRPTRAWEWGLAASEVGSNGLCFLGQDLALKILEQVSVQDLPGLRAGSGMGWKPFEPEPLPPGWETPPTPWSPYRLLLSFWGCYGNAATRGA